MRLIEIGPVVIPKRSGIEVEQKDSVEEIGLKTLSWRGARQRNSVGRTGLRDSVEGAKMRNLVGGVGETGRAGEEGGEENGGDLDSNRRPKDAVDRQKGYCLYFYLCLLK